MKSLGLILSLSKDDTKSAERFRKCHPGRAKPYPGSPFAFGKIPCLRSSISCRGAHGMTPIGSELFNRIRDEARNSRFFSSMLAKTWSIA
ncbi:MAG: hypothetical protein WAN43_03850 [Rhodomicrobium sp.]